MQQFPYVVRKMAPIFPGLNVLTSYTTMSQLNLISLSKIHQTAS